MSRNFTEKQIKQIMAMNKAGFSKKLGQNFLTDYGVIEDIAIGAKISEEDHVIEIGPGIGVLTVELAEYAGLVTAVEIDKKLIPILSQTLVGIDNVEIINDDILKTDLQAIIEKARAENPNLKRVKIVGNLPYYITTPIIMKLLESEVPAESITVMMQKEVADRLTAKPGKKAYGAITVAVDYYCTSEVITQVPAECFIPKPKVDSTVLRLDLRDEKPVQLADETVFFEVIKAAFGQRRKTLLNCLTGYREMTKEEAGDVLESAGIDPIRRGETLSTEDFAALANKICEKD